MYPLVAIVDGDTVREILPELIGQLVKLYSSQEFERKEVSSYCTKGYSLSHLFFKTATRTTTELSRKSGEKVLGEIFSVLHAKSRSPDIRIREGVCLMLCDVM